MLSKFQRFPKYLGPKKSTAIDQKQKELSLYLYKGILFTRFPYELSTHSHHLKGNFDFHTDNKTLRANALKTHSTQKKNDKKWLFFYSFQKFNLNIV
ncbi:hypothetical protein Gasu2_29680 [Galdieria sulphuraria]|nr:hypothetical protein Gasu2_29680 [Galdieria sulphuraria]